MVISIPVFSVEVYTMQLYVIKFVSVLRSWWFSPRTYIRYMSLFSLIISWRSVILLPQPQTFQMLLTTFIIFSLIEHTSPWVAGELKNILC